MVLVAVLLCTCLFSSSGFGFISPGPCPQLPPSNTSLEEDIHQAIRTLVPFAASESLIFQKPARGHISCLSLNMDKGLEELTIGLASLSKRTARGFFTGFAEGSVHLNSSIYDLGGDYLPSECHEPMKETLRFWVLNAGGVLLWACKEQRDKQANDQALIVATTSFHNPDKLRTEAENLLGSPLSQLMLWEETPRMDCYQDDFYPCP